MRQRTVRQETTKYKSGTLPLNMYQTEEQIGEKLEFSGASEEGEEAIEGGKYSDESGTDPDSDKAKLVVFENHSLRTQYLHQ